MVAISASGPLRPLHPLHAILLGFVFPLFLGALLSDLGYWVSYQTQWSNFSSWFIVGGLIGGGFALLWALINLFRGGISPKTRPIIYFVVLLAMWGLGIVNILVHAKDAWAIMPESLYLSGMTALLALIAAWIGYSGFRVREVA